MNVFSISTSYDILFLELFFHLNASNLDFRVVDK